MVIVYRFEVRYGKFSHMPEQDNMITGDITIQIQNRNENKLTIIITKQTDTIVTQSIQFNSMLKMTLPFTKFAPQRMSR